MLENFKNIIRPCVWPLKYAIDFWEVKVRNRLPVLFYDSEMNVGDDLNRFLLERLSGKKVHRIKTKCFRHLLPVGSILSYAQKKSVVYGSGLIAPSSISKDIKFEKLLALRGQLTRDRVLDLGYDFYGPLGDPALLMPKFIKYSVEKKYDVGVVLHYSHKAFQAQVSCRQYTASIKFIDVQQPIESFLKEMLQCGSIVSSSLHGLILADAYKIPNQWVVFKECLPGGDFKFRDYYSTTDCPSCSPVRIGSPDDFLIFVNQKISSAASVKKYMKDVNELQQVFLDFER